MNRYHLLACVISFIFGNVLIVAAEHHYNRVVDGWALAVANVIMLAIIVILAAFGF